MEYFPGPGVVTNLTQGDLETALASGALVTFGVNGRIALSDTLLIEKSATLDGTGRSIKLDGQNLVRHFVVTNGATLRLVNLTLMNGRFVGADGEPNGNGFPGSGGSIYTSGGTLELVGCRFIGNSAQGGNGGTPTLCPGCIFGETLGASGFGGALYVTNGTLRVSHCTFADNHALGGQGRTATIYTAGGTERQGYKISSRGNGGAIYIGSGEMELRNSTLVSNEARGGPGEGSGIGGQGGDGFGGGIYSKGALTVINCTLAENEANGGAGLPSFNPTPGGSAYGGGIFASSGSISLLNTTVALNSATAGEDSRGPISYMVKEAQGGSFAIAGGYLKLINSILFCSPGQTNVSGAVVDGGHNISSDSSARFSTSFSRSNLNPLLAALADNGGLTPTMALLPGSPAIDTGDDTAAPQIDQRGVGRPAGFQSDIGAFEVTLPSGTPRILNVFRIGPTVRLSVLTTSGSRYALERSESLGNEWTPIQTVDGDGTDRVLIDSNAIGEQSFYRVRVE